jgi:hypothetical protein
MHSIITFTTVKFDVTKEKKNPINPIYGESILQWLKEKLKNEIEIDEPDADDWGWYSSISWDGRNYLLGASAEKSKDNEYEWVFQVDKQRTMKEKIFGKEKMTKDDPCLRFFKNIFDKESEFKNVKIE